jgi:hypothetical protein
VKTKSRRPRTSEVMGMRFVRDGIRDSIRDDTVFLLERDDGLDLLEWLGLGRPEFGAIEARVLAPLCRRRLWPMPRNVDAAVVEIDPRDGTRRQRPAGTLCRWTLRLLQLAEQGDRQSIISFG